MRERRLIFALFAAAVLFSMIREWNAPASCLRLELRAQSHSSQKAR
jgi:hypothetical protein